MYTLDNDGPHTAWAIFLKDKDSGEYIFHSAHWSKTRAKEMLWHEWKRPKIVKVTIQKFFHELRTSHKTPLA